MDSVKEVRKLGKRVGEMRVREGREGRGREKKSEGQ